MFYIFHGNDSHAQKETVAKLIGKLGDPAMLDLNTTRLEGRVTFTQLHQAASVIPFLAKVRLVIVQDLLSNKLDKGLQKQIADYLPTLPETTRLLFLESKPLKKNNPFVKLATSEKSGYVKQFSKPKGAALEHWIRQQVEMENGRISPQATHMLAANIGSQMEILSRELEKLLLYCNGEEIQAEQVKLLSPYAAEASIFDLVDAIGNRNGKKASQLLQEKFLEGADPFYLFSMFIRQFRLLIQVKELADDGKRPPAISQALKLHGFVVGKLYQQCQGFSLPQLEQIYRHLLEIDVAVKTGRNEMKTALNLLVAALTVTA
ncbi:DNA polymerase III delta subunit [hydrothermal vent metagenome]|uniref:DNA polymerase III subunit delta n=1 Tax=hydrothermal vent metagenome TaxID=652676 RepID=A0A3B0VDK2_9ZZZZ